MQTQPPLPPAAVFAPYATGTDVECEPEADKPPLPPRQTPSQSPPESVDKVELATLTPLTIYDVYLHKMENGEARRYLDGPTTITIFTDATTVCPSPSRTIASKKGLCIQGEGDPRVLFMPPTNACLCSNDFEYVMRGGDDEFYMLLLASNTPKEIVDQFETIFMYHCFFYKKIFTDEEKEKMRVLYRPSSTSTKVGDKLEAGGVIAAKGLVAGAGKVGSGIRRGTNFVKQHTNKNEGDGEISEESKKRMEAAAKVSNGFRKGMTTVMGGIQTATHTAGSGIAAGGHWGYKQYQQTDHYKKKQEEKKPSNEPSKTDAVLTVGKGGLSAIGNVWSGVVISTKMVAGDVRDNTSEIVEHKKGKDHGEMTRKGFNVAANSAIGGYETFTLVNMQYKLLPKLAFQVGVGALTYDPYKQDVLHGLGWKEGWIQFEGDAMEPWRSRWAVLHTYSLAWYAQPTDERPKGYVPLRRLLEVRSIPSEQTKHKHSIQIISKDGIILASLQCDDAPGWSEDLYPPERELASWKNAVMCLASVQTLYLHWVKIWFDCFIFFLFFFSLMDCFKKFWKKFALF